MQDIKLVYKTQLDFYVSAVNKFEIKDMKWFILAQKYQYFSINITKHMHDLCEENYNSDGKKWRWTKYILHIYK